MTTGSTKSPPATKKRGRPISKHTPAEKKQMSLEQEAREFFNKKLQEDPVPGDPNWRNFYAGSALSGLLASGTFSRPEEVVAEAFRYADIMLTRIK
jgi:hypothetical protein